MAQMIRNRVRSWLGMAEPRDWTTDFERLERDTWKYQQVIKRRVDGTCPGCKKTIHLWPLETEAYYTKDGEAYHVSCYMKFGE